MVGEQKDIGEFNMLLLARIEEAIRIVNGEDNNV